MMPEALHLLLAPQRVRLLNRAHLRHATAGDRALVAAMVSGRQRCWL